MHLSRRKFFRTLSMGAAAGAAAQLPLARLAHASLFEPTRTRETGGPILLNSNENVYGPSQKVSAVIRAATTTVNRYPFEEYDGLARRIASFHKVNPEQVVFGAGSSEILRVAAAAFLGSGKRLIEPSPTFEAIQSYARSVGAEVVPVPLDAQFAHDLPRMLGHVDNSTSLIYICNPNNPTASLTPRADLETFISKLPASCYVLIDEAYHHYAGASSTYKSFLDQPVANERVIVSRTFSKVYGLAGLRLGYAIASLETAKRLNSYLTYDGVNGIAVKAAIAAMDDGEGVAEFIKRNADSRQEFFNQAMARMLKPIDSHANFVMMDTHNPVEPVIEHFRKRNILIGRRFPAMDTYIRISLGTAEEMGSFWTAWDALPFAKMPMGH